MEAEEREGGPVEAICEPEEEPEHLPPASHQPSETVEYDPVKKYSNLFVFSGGNKAGMQEMDKEKQAQVIYEMSKNTAYFKRAAKLDEEATEKAKKLQISFNEVRGSLAQRLQSGVEQKFLELEKRRRFDRICCVLDMDMFFAAVEIRDQPHLKDLPVAVGGISMISTSNYVARRYGVRAAMPGFIAKKLCPSLVFVSGNFSKYEAVSSQVKAIIREFDPQLRSFSLDEVYFDLAPAARRRYAELHGASHNQGEGLGQGLGQQDEDEDDSDDQLLAVEQADGPSIESLRAIAALLLQEIRRRITAATGGLTCSAGLANNFLLAKICADINKPDGQYELPADRSAVLAFLASLPVRRVPGIGKVTEKVLGQLGIATLGQVRETFAAKILHAFTATTADFLLRVSLGLDADEGRGSSASVSSSAAASRQRKSIGCERTYSARGISGRAELYGKLEELAGRVAHDLGQERIRGGRTLTLKVKDVDFGLHSRAFSAPAAQLLGRKEEIFRVACELLDSLRAPGLRVRLLGLALSRLHFLDPPASSSSSAPGGRSVVDFFRSAQSRPRDLSAAEEEDQADSEGEGEGEGEEDWAGENRGVDVIDLLADDEDQRDEQESEELGKEGEEEEPQAHAQDQGELLCPVCRERVAGGLVQLNGHLDDCLTRRCLADQLLPSPMPSPSRKHDRPADQEGRHGQPPLKQRRQQPAANGIDRFFLRPQGQP